MENIGMCFRSSIVTLVACHSDWSGRTRSIKANKIKFKVMSMERCPKYTIMCEKTNRVFSRKHFLTISCNDEQDKTGSGCHQDVLKAVLEAA